ncbi:beta-ketoacyl synthase N-terminal-like domain-containing protein [Streptomyces sp. NPDC053079]|uniref:beta-ketoacyl synthase N-terminal-like domain-containing protein n=1 Tax=Streptomyces sp. NPDC053079 TaxID=3365697 RepID=UPI0037CF7172
MSADALVVTGIGIVSPWGNDPSRLALDDDGRPDPTDSWFDVAAELGPRGYKYVPPSCRYLLAATRRALSDAGDLWQGVPETRRGMAVGTNNGIATLIDAMDETISGPGAARLGPATAPYFSINTLAGRVAMDHGVKGWNLTLTSPRTAALEALGAGARAVVAGRSDVFLAASTEAPPPRHAPGRGVLEAGAAVLVLEPSAQAAARGATAYGTCRTVVFFLPADASRTVARRTVDDALTRLLAPQGHDGPPPVHLVTDTCPVGTALAAHLRDVGARTRAVPAAAGTLLPFLHVIHALTGQGPPRLVATTSPEGTCALTLVRPHPTTHHTREDR